jgi:cell wall-associated NlpC family hydrolase
MTHWATRYIGLPWANGAQGPDAFDCWALVRHVQREHYGRELPIIGVDADDLAAVGAAFAGHPERARWQRVDAPQDGDCVLTHRGAQLDHVGVYLDLDGGRVLHAVRGSGVVCTALPVLQRLGWHPVEFYRRDQECFSRSSPLPLAGEG